MRVKGPGMTYQMGPSLIWSAWGIRFTHEVCAFFIVHGLPLHIPHARRDDCSSLQRNMLVQRILHILGRRGPQSFHVGAPDGLDWGVLLVHIALPQGGVKRPAVMVGSAWDGSADVQRVDGVARLLAAVVVEMRSPVSGAMLVGEHGQRAVRHVTRVSLPQGTAPMEEGVFSSISGLVLLGEHLERPVGSIAGIALNEGAGTVVTRPSLVTPSGHMLRGGPGNGHGVGSGQDGALVPVGLGRPSGMNRTLALQARERLGLGDRGRRRQRFGSRAAPPAQDALEKWAILV